MRKAWKALSIGALVLAFAAPSFAAPSRSQKRDGSGNGTPARKIERKRDGSCEQPGTPMRKRDGTGNGTPQRKQEGSCQQ